MKFFIASLLAFVLCVGSASAQAACEKIYAQAVEAQKTMTVASQKKAIELFKKAQGCYDSKAKKDLCASQITTCNNTIKLIQKPKTNSKSDPTVSEEPAKPTKEPVANDVDMRFSTYLVQFKAKGEFQSVKVDCNYPDWKVIDYPSWITCSINAYDEIVLKAEKNSESSNRQGVVKVSCRGTVLEFEVSQKKKGILDNLKESVDNIGL